MPHTPCDPAGSSLCAIQYVVSAMRSGDVAACQYLLAEVRHTSTSANAQAQRRMGESPVGHLHLAHEHGVLQEHPGYDCLQHVII